MRTEYDPRFIPSPLQQIVMEYVGEVQDFHRENHHIPEYATVDEIVNAFKSKLLDTLCELYSHGLVCRHKTVNGKLMFGVCNQQPNQQ